jgi:predicted DNA-binding antitoxin AbrB/MazE fold protein
MRFQVDAVYENGVLRPLVPLDLNEHELVVVSVLKTSTLSRSGLAVEYLEGVKREREGAVGAPGLGEVRRRLAKIPGAMADEIIAERGER